VRVLVSLVIVVQVASSVVALWCFFTPRRRRDDGQPLRWFAVQQAATAVGFALLAEWALAVYAGCVAVILGLYGHHYFVEHPRNRDDDLAPTGRYLEHWTEDEL
jgi:hypothetical protein